MHNYKLIFINISVLILLVLAGCTHGFHSYKTGNYIDTNGNVVNLRRTTQITVEKKQDVILGLTFDTDYVEEAYSELLDECQGGEIVGVQVKHITDLKFLHYTDRIFIQARCYK